MERTAERWDRARQAALLVLFCVFLFTPLAASLMGLPSGPKLTEKRAPEPRPRAPRSWADLAQYPAAFDRYFGTAFGFRNWLAYGYNAFVYIGLGGSPLPDRVIVGTDGWLYYGDRDEVITYQRVEPFSRYDMARLEKNLSLVQGWFSKRGLPLLFVIPPNKSTVYPEHLPGWLHRAEAPSRLDQFMSAARACGVRVVDLRDEFDQAKSGLPLYYRMDTHWTDCGAALACAAILRATGRDPGPRPRLGSDAPAAYSGDLTLMLGLDRLLSEDRPALEWPAPRKARLVSWSGAEIGEVAVYATGGTNLPSALIFRDSFGSSLVPLLAPHYRTVKSIWSYRLRFDEIARFAPDVVIYECVERRLSTGADFFGNPVDLFAATEGVLMAVNLPRRTGGNVEVPDSSAGAVRRAAEGSAPRGWLMFGPYASLSPGPYMADFRVRSRADAAVDVARLQVTAERGRAVLAERTVTGGGAGTWRHIELPFEVGAGGAGGVEYRAEYLGAGDIEVDYVKVSGRAEAAREQTK